MRTQARWAIPRRHARRYDPPSSPLARQPRLAVGTAGAIAQPLTGHVAMPPAVHRRTRDAKARRNVNDTHALLELIDYLLAHTNRRTRVTMEPHWPS